eukprot:m.469958 g.469958  ORF g.469958 m.469958 type:complete len:813 (+) comp29261_c0_seq1:117-2555(+)
MPTIWSWRQDRGHLSTLRSASLAAHQPISRYLLAAAAAVVALNTASGAEGTGPIARRSLASQCPSLYACLHDSRCTECLYTVRPFSEDSMLVAINRQRSRQFFSTLTAAAACNGNASLAGNALFELSWFGGPCRELAAAQAFDYPEVGTCQGVEAVCFSTPPCSECLTRLITNHHASQQILTSPTCRAVNPAVISDLRGNCRPFPGCTAWKEHCRNTAGCTECLAMLGQGDVSSAIGHCSAASDTYNSSRQALDFVVFECTAATDVGCEYWKGRCTEIPVLQACLEALDYGRRLDIIVAAAASPKCRAAYRHMNESEGEAYLNDYFNGCTNIVSTCVRQTYFCAMDPWCAQCLNGSHPPDSPHCLRTLGFSTLAAVCSGCPDVIAVINRAVIATAVVGGVSLVLCLAIVCAIFAEGRDRFSIQGRIIVGLMVANAIYSSANMIPTNLYHTGTTDCGRNVLSFPEIRFGRAWWFCGKFALGACEVVMMCVSLRVLHSGPSSIRFGAEMGMQLVCLVVGISAFTVFYTESVSINNAGYNSQTLTLAQTNTYNYLSLEDDQDDDTIDVTAAQQYETARDRYDSLTQAMLQIWLGLLGLAVALWLCLRVAFARLVSKWKTAERAAQAQWDRDLWSSDDAGARLIKQRVLDLMRKGYDDVAKPLEPYIAVFVAFGVPAVVMATDYCRDNSSANAPRASGSSDSSSTVAYGTCDVWCELVLSFRSLATVAVYLSWPEHRQALLAPVTLFRKLSRRTNRGSRRRKVTFSSTNYLEESLIPEGKGARNVDVDGVIYDLASNEEIEEIQSDSESACAPTDM